MSPYEFPPDIFWISPDGGVYEVIGHLTAIQAKPELFELPSSPKTRAEVDRAFSALFEQGWVRGRFSDGTFYFQMGRPRGLSLAAAHGLVLKFQAQAKEVSVDFAPGPYRPKDFSVEDFIDQKFPQAWGINPPRRAWRGR
jgi:hypothetical protein